MQTISRTSSVEWGNTTASGSAADLRTEEGCQSVFAFVSEQHGRCDILVNCAGAARPGPFLTLSEQDWQDGFALKFFGCVRLCRLFWPMLAAAKGHVVNIVGGAARQPEPDMLIGAAVNAAMNNFTKGLSVLGKRDGVNVNAILPGLTETERLQQFLSQRAQESGSSIDEVRALLTAKLGLSRPGKPEEVAALALFLCSSSARYIQGTSIGVDGGATVGVY
jgi:NAD(P)-dependent dehydrogenase (short-subunit alcohol dehydrogenase family)